MLPLDWQWTNAEHTEARAGAWVATPAVAKGDRWAFRHDDFPGYSIVTGLLDSASQNWHQFVRRNVAPSFLAWLAAQPAPQPPEPTTFGAMVKVGAVEYVRVNYDNDRVWQSDSKYTFAVDWDTLTKLGPVEVLR